jgi:hypothetical protein
VQKAADRWLTTNDNVSASQINVDHLAEELLKHPDRHFAQYLLDGIKNGFDTMVSKTNLPTVECKNLQSAFRNISHQLIWHFVVYFNSNSPNSMGKLLMT